MKPRHSVLLAAILALPIVGGAPNEPSTQPESPALSQGMILTIDANGKIVQGTPQASALRDALGDAISTSDEGLVVEKVPGGGIKIDLQGRFQNAMTVEKDADGTITAAPCITGTTHEVNAAEVE